MTIDDWTAFAVYQHTRFTVAEFKLALHYFQIPAVFHTRNRLKVGGEEAFIIACARLTYPNRLSALETIFNRDYTEISRIAQDFTCEFVRLNAHCEDLRHLLTEARLRDFNTAIRAQQAQRDQTLNIVVDAVFAAREGMTALYVDGVTEFVARPSVRPEARALFIVCSVVFFFNCLPQHIFLKDPASQAALYRGDKKRHSYRYLAVTGPDLLAYLSYGPFAGRQC